MLLLSVSIFKCFTWTNHFLVLCEHAKTWPVFSHKKHLYYLILYHIMLLYYNTWGEPSLVFYVCLPIPLYLWAYFYCKISSVEPGHNKIHPMTGAVFEKNGSIGSIYRTKLLCRWVQKCISFMWWCRLYFPFYFLLNKTWLFFKLIHQVSYLPLIECK